MSSVDELVESVKKGTVSLVPEPHCSLPVTAPQSPACLRNSEDGEGRWGEVREGVARLCRPHRSLSGAGACGGG